MEAKLKEYKRYLSCWVDSTIYYIEKHKLDDNLISKVIELEIDFLKSNIDTIDLYTRELNNIIDKDKSEKIKVYYYKTT